MPKQTKEQTKAKVRKVQQGLGVTVDGIYGPITSSSLMNAFRGPMASAVKFAENNKKNHGVLSVETTNPTRVLNNSVRNNLNRFMRGQQSNMNYDNSNTPKFVDFMQERWAPVGAANDPDNLNQNWAPNVRHYLKKQYPEQYPVWKAMDLVKNKQQMQEPYYA